MHSHEQTDPRIQKIKSLIRNVPDFPKKGIQFKDVTTLFKDAEGFRLLIEVLKERYQGQQIDVVCGIESRGFIIGAALAIAVNAGFVPIRKKGKLPFESISQAYELEYGTDHIEIHTDAIQKGQKVLVVDDLIATGGTLNAACQLIEKLQGEIIECVAPVELPELGGRKRVKYPLHSIIEFDGE